MKNAIYIFLLITSVICTSQAQGILKGKVDNYEGPETSILSIDMMSNSFDQIGTMSADGTFEILLAENYIEATSTSEEEKEAMAKKGFKESKNTVKSSFECYDKLIYEAGETQVAGLPVFRAVANIQEQKMYGYLHSGSSAEFIEGFLSFGQKNMSKGYHVNWFYSEGEATAKGECSVENFTYVEDESFMRIMKYDISLKKGWNIVIYEVEKVFESADGKVYDAVAREYVVDELPDDVQWVFEPKTKM